MLEYTLSDLLVALQAACVCGQDVLAPPDLIRAQDFGEFVQGSAESTEYLFACSPLQPLVGVEALRPAICAKCEAHAREIVAGHYIPVKLLLDALVIPMVQIQVQQLDRRPKGILFEDEYDLAEDLQSGESTSTAVVSPKRGRVRACYATIYCTARG